MTISTSEGISHYFLFMGGFYTAFTFYSAITNFNSEDLYTLFLKPVTLLIMAAYSSVFLTLRDSETGVLRHILTALLAIFPVILALVPFFYYIRYPFVSFIIIIVIIAPGLYFYYRDRGV
ncbi:MAG: hypothetical protein FWD87_05580 [Spirochaetaceae bacterium]|nr:hypothetical protein [Spirochaetaceae bacterium]